MLGSSAGPAGSPAVDRRLLVSYDNYPAAQRAVDTLSDAGYPVQNVAIVGSDLRMEELVTGRLTNGRAAAQGAVSGAVFGLVIGLFLGLFTTTTASFFALVVWAILWGAVLGGAFGFTSHAFKGGTRDFTSRSAIVAGRYDVLVPSAALEEALAVLEGGTKPADTVVVARPPSSGPLSTAAAPARPAAPAATTASGSVPGTSPAGPAARTPHADSASHAPQADRAASAAQRGPAPHADPAGPAWETGDAAPTSRTDADGSVPGTGGVTSWPQAQMPGVSPQMAGEQASREESTDARRAATAVTGAGAAAASPDPAHADRDQADPESPDMAADAGRMGTAESSIVRPATSREEAMEEATVAIPLSAVPTQRRGEAESPAAAPRSAGTPLTATPSGSSADTSATSTPSTGTSPEDAPSEDARYGDDRRATTPSGQDRLA
ncbi:hypothetical protein Sme01_37270 [Sphaerisporangium melleum]|uniref:General stress protein 17M-like domain-containing protein n=1 Tax=Sphaerisporangium melleum TaxID=321316 RepID=A0A917RBJ6_9ACTN|nr:general stress protein [Sphaerisporangium melleum]GGL00123.1 hypothetical protein GCM10007964_47810 [Sphaerisporangium melleum]GII71251.1 hypothetical protein Sme01_37270 [Sphaerisporangium melleum]